MLAVFERLLAPTRGNFVVHEPKDDILIRTRDAQSLALFCHAYPFARLFTRTDEGECFAVFLHGNGDAMFPPPSLPTDMGGLYLNDGEPVFDRPSEVIIPASEIGKLEKLSFYSLADLKVMLHPALIPQRARTVQVDPSLLHGKSSQEKKHLLELDDRCSVGIIGN